MPALYYLAGLTCTEETFAIKAGAQRVAAELGLALVTCDTSPRALALPGDDDDWDFGHGAGFYLDATRGAVVERLPHVHATSRASCPRWSRRTSRSTRDARGIFGHSMGGHGALVLALRNPSALPQRVGVRADRRAERGAWGEKAFTRLPRRRPRSLARVRRDRAARGARLRSARRSSSTRAPPTSSSTTQLKPELLEAACARPAQPLELRRHDGYDHSYYFIATFIETPAASRAGAAARATGTTGADVRAQ